MCAGGHSVELINATVSIGRFSRWREVEDESVRPEYSLRNNSEVLEENLLYGEHSISKLKCVERYSAFHGFIGVH